MDDTGTCFSENSSFEQIGVYFKQAQDGRNLPRSVLVDLDPDGISSMLCSFPDACFYDSLNCVSGYSGAGNNWTKGYYANIAFGDRVMETIRKEVEECDCLQGFQLCHSLGGGTGSGLGALICSRLQEEYGNQLLQAWSVFPASDTLDAVVQPYNTVLSMPQLIENAGVVAVFDNEALWNIAFRSLRIPQPTYSDLNYIVSGLLSSLTSLTRFPTSDHLTPRKVITNMCPFPRLHFLITSFSPLVTRGTCIYSISEPRNLIENMFNGSNRMCACEPTHGVYFSALAVFRGTRTAEVEMEFEQQIRRDPFVSWIPDNFRKVVCPVSDYEHLRSAAFLANSTAVQEVFARVGSQFLQLFRRKAFLHWYTDEGMDEMEFTETYSILKELISEFEQFEKSRFET